MAKLIKEEVIAQFTEAYLAKHGKEPTIEQKGSWFKVDGGKSVRLTELADMIADLGTSSEVKAPEAKPAKKSETTKAKAAEKPKAAKAKKPKAGGGNGGLTPKQLWAQKLAKGSKLPRGL